MTMLRVCHLIHIYLFTRLAILVELGEECVQLDGQASSLTDNGCCDICNHLADSTVVMRRDCTGTV